MVRYVPTNEEVRAKVTLLDYTRDPLHILYLAYKRAVSPEALADLKAAMDSGELSDAEIVRFLERQKAIGHTSPYYMVHFTFAIDGVSRSLAAQLERHHVGTSYEEMSLRYTRLPEEHPVVTPRSMHTHYLSENEDFLAESAYLAVRNHAFAVYNALVENGVPAEDARYALPLGLTTHIMWDVNFGALLHIADLRLCTQAQWEIRGLMKQVRKAVIEVEPVLGRMLAPKCMPWRGALCDESKKAWAGCPLGKVRPHKSLFESDETETAIQLAKVVE